MGGARACASCQPGPAPRRRPSLVFPLPSLSGCGEGWRALRRPRRLLPRAILLKNDEEEELLGRPTEKSGELEEAAAARAPGFPRSRGSPGAKGSPGRGTGEPRLPRGAPLPAPCTMSWGTELWVSEGPGPPGWGAGGAKGSPGRGTGEPRLPRGAPLPAPCTMSWGTELWVSEGPGPPGWGAGGRCLARLGRGRGPGCFGGGDGVRVGVPAACGGDAGLCH